MEYEKISIFTEQLENKRNELIRHMENHPVFRKNSLNGDDAHIFYMNRETGEVNTIESMFYYEHIGEEGEAESGLYIDFNDASPISIFDVDTDTIIHFANLLQQQYE